VGEHESNGYLYGYVKRVRAALEALPLAEVEASADVLARGAAEGRHIFVIGNGGSATTASHLASDLVRLSSGDRPVRATCLSDSPALLTALANDHGYEHVFARQLERLLQPGDVLVALSTSGRSPNIIRAIERTHELGGMAVALLGGDGGPAADLADHAVIVPAVEPELVEDVHLLLTHALAGYARERILAIGAAPA
jgi:D-sedoheptulose 7-phosphate isomerase